MKNLPVYILITAARDEAQFIELTIKSVLKQRARPSRWMIVSDGSTDKTEDIVAKYVAEYPWIKLVQMPKRRERNFAGKAYAFNAGYALVKDASYDVIGNLDGDLSFGENYFLSLLGHFTDDGELGVVGSPFQQVGSSRIYDYRLAGMEHVSGACQLFRRECFEDIGGYTPVKGGGVDHIALLNARMKGWKTRTFMDEVCWHHRPMGRAKHGPLRARFENGIKDYRLGGHPVWECFRVCYQMAKKPLAIGGLLLGAGYMWALVRRSERPMSPEMVKFRRREQMQRLRGLVGKGLSGIFSRSSEQKRTLDDERVV